MEGKSTQPRNWSGTYKWILIAIFILALTAVTWFSFNHYLSLSKARIALYNAKTACLAVQSVSMEYKALGRPFGDTSGPGGLTPEAAEAAASLGSLRGRLVSVQTEKDGYGFTALIYELDGYIVEFSREDGTEKWQVYQKTARITS